MHVVMCGLLPRGSHSRLPLAGRHLSDMWITHSGPLLVSEAPASGIQWQQAALQQPSGRFQLSCTLMGERLVVIGGIDENGKRECPLLPAPCPLPSPHLLFVAPGSDETWGLNCAHLGEGGEGSWQQIDAGNAPSARGAHAAAWGGCSKMIVFGGINQEAERLNDTWMLVQDTQSLTWRQVAVGSPLPEARSGHSLTWVREGRVVLFGGRGANLNVLQDTWIMELHDHRGGESSEPSGR